MCDVHNVLYIDLHKTFSTMLHLRRPDGIHWNSIGIRLMNEIILNHIKGYYNGVKDFKCPSLREELGNKMNQFKQQIRRSNIHRSKIDYLKEDFSDDDIKTNNHNKRKRNDDDEKENDYYQRKVIAKSKINENQQRTVIIKKSMPNEIDQDKFDHEYCDIMYDNEYEGLHLLHFCSHDIEPSEELEHDSLDIDIKPTILIPFKQTDSSG